MISAIVESEFEFICPALGVYIANTLINLIRMYYYYYSWLMPAIIGITSNPLCQPVQLIKRQAKQTY